MVGLGYVVGWDGVEVEGVGEGEAGSGCGAWLFGRKAEAGARGSRGGGRGGRRRQRPTAGGATRSGTSPKTLTLLRPHTTRPPN